MTHTFHQPDEEKMRQALKRYSFDPVGIILHLAWREGLERNEIHDLTWARVDFDAELIRLPDREVPLEAGTAEALKRWKSRCEGFSLYVAVSYRLRTHMALQSISSLARNALDSVGQTEITLKDLRYDFIRRQLAEHYWADALRVSGISVTSYRSGFAKFKEPAGPVPPKPEETKGDEFLLWRILQSERSSPAGIALWLLQQMGLQLEEISGLTWEDIDFEASALRLHGETVLADEKNRRVPGDDPHVLLTPRSRKPISPDRLSIMIRDTLIRGGISSMSGVDIRRGLARDVEWKALSQWIDEHGSITPREAAGLLELSEGQAWRRLQTFSERNRLVHIGTRYYSAAQTPPVERHRELILQRAAEAGEIQCREAAELLHIPSRLAGRILKRMTEEGDLVLAENKRGYLPAGKIITSQKQGDGN